jgi:GNAT superfamily N-acetyltransferase
MEKKEMSLYEDDSTRARIYFFRPHLKDIRIPKLENGYLEGESGEEMVPTWALLMNQVFGSSVDDPPLVKDDRFSHDRVVIVLKDDIAVGLCIGWYEPTLWPNSGQIFFTVVHEEHRRRKIGEFVVAKMLERFFQEGFHNAILSTENYRIPAMCLYHKLGFIPLMTGEVDDEEERWQQAVTRANKPEFMDTIWDDYGHITKKRS